MAWAPAAAACAVVALVLLPAAAWAGRRQARRVRGGAALAAMLFGFGEGIDPPARRRVEAVSDREEDAPAPGDPPLTPP